MTRGKATSTEFVVWSYALVDRACSLEPFNGWREDYRLTDGDRVSGDFPSKVRWRMDRDRPKDTLLTDYLYNTDRLIVASERLRDVIARHDQKFIEFLPITIVDHKGKAIRQRYFIVHPVEPVDCLDLKKCKPTYDDLRPDQIWRLERLAIVESKIPEERVLLRAKAFDRAILTRRSLAKAIDEAGCAGMSWVETKDYSLD